MVWGANAAALLQGVSSPGGKKLLFGTVAFAKQRRICTNKRVVVRKMKVKRPGGASPLRIHGVALAKHRWRAGCRGKVHVRDTVDPRHLRYSTEKG